MAHHGGEPGSGRALFVRAETGNIFVPSVGTRSRLPPPLPHGGPPPREFLPFLSGRAEYPQVRHLLPLCGVGLGRRGHREAGGRAISRVLFARRGGQMVISLGWLSPATSRGLPAAQRPGPGLAAYLALLRLGVTVPRLLPGARWALTPPFHPYPLDKRAVCFLWPFPSPRGAQVLPGSVPSGARTFLSTPLPPACRDHHALPPPARKATGSGRVGASLALEPPQEASEAVGGQPLPPGRSSGLLGRNPEAVAFREHHLPDTRPVTRAQRRRN